MSANLYIPPDHYLVDELYTDEHKIVRQAARDWVNRAIKPVIEEYYEKAIFPLHLVREMGENGLFGPFIPEEYGGAGLDRVATEDRPDKHGRGPGVVEHVVARGQRVLGVHQKRC